MQQLDNQLPANNQQSTGQQIKIDDLVVLYMQISKLTNEICTSIDKKFEPVTQLNRLNYLLDAHFEEVWAMLHTSAHDLGIVPQKQQIQGEDGGQGGSNEENTDAQINSSAEKNEGPDVPVNVRLAFYHDVLAAISFKMLSEFSVQNQSYMDEIQLFFKIIVSKFFARDTTCKELADVAASLFDATHSLHQRAFQKHDTPEGKAANYKISEHKKRVESERDWRLNELKVGEQVDVVKAITIRGLLAQSWCRGTVMYIGRPEENQAQPIGQAIDESEDPLEYLQIEVKYAYDREATVKNFKLSDWKIAPVGSYTDDNDWRLEIKVGDLIDCMDDEKDWYKSTVNGARVTTNPDGEQVPEIYVAFRTYDDEGSKTDEEGNKYYGWSERYDAWCGVADVQVQRLHACHLQYRKVEAQNRVYDRAQDYDDREDLLYCNKAVTCYAAERARLFARSYVMADALNTFGRSGGFDRILEHMLAAKRGIASVTIEHLLSLTAFLARTQPLWHKQFATRFVDQLTDTLLEALCYVNPELNDQNQDQIVLGPLQARNFEAAMLDQMVDSFVDPTWRRHFTLEMLNRKQSLFRIGVGAALMGLTNLKKRIQGIKYMSEAIRAVRQAYQPHRGMNAKELISELRGQGMIDQIFGESTHYQLVHRSQDLIRLLFNEKEVRESDIDAIWNVCNKQGQQIKLEIYRIILEVLRAAYNCMTDQTKEHFIDKIASMHPSQLIEKDIEIVTELGKKGGVAYRQPEAFVQKAAGLLWSIAVREKDYPRSTSKVARKKFCEQVQSWDDSYKEGYVAQCLDNISHNKVPLQSLKIALKLIEKMNQSNYTTNKRTRQDFAQDLIATQEFDDLIIKDLDNYVAYANSLVQKGELTAENRGSLVLSDNHPFNHFKNLKSRLKRLRSLLLHSKGKLSAAQMEQIWEIVVEKSELRAMDQGVFFNWFKSLLGKEHKRVLSEDLLTDLFRKKIVHCDVSLLKALRLNGLECIVRLFALVNELQGNLEDLEPQSSQDSSWQQPTTSYATSSVSVYSPNAGSGNEDEASSQSRAKYTRFRVNVLPQDLEGIRILWTVLGHCEASNSGLFQMVQRTLINIYTNLSPSLAAQAEFISDSFIQECLSCLEGLASENLGKTEKEKKDSVKCISQMLTAFFEGTELQGLGKMRLHRQLEEAPFLTKIVVEATLPIRRGQDANFLEISTPASMTLWELKLLVAQHTNTSPLCLDLKRGDNKKLELKDFRHCKLLSDLKFTDGETLTATRAPPPDVPRAALLDKDGKTVPELQTIISSWFQTFSATLSREELVEAANKGPEEGRYTPEAIEELPETLRAMTREACASFAEAITTLTNLDANDYRVTVLFDKYSRALGNGQLLVEPELQAFYQEQAVSKPDVVRQNLTHQGVGHDLKPLVDWSRLSLDTDTRVIKEEATLPRSKLASNHALFEQMLDRVERASGDEAEYLWDLLMNLPTNQQIEQRILDNENLDELLGLGNSQVLPGQEGLHRVLYCLQIIQSLVCEYKRRPESKIVAHIQDSRPGQSGPYSGQHEEAAMAFDGNRDSDFPALDTLEEPGNSGTMSMNRQGSDSPARGNERAVEAEQNQQRNENVELYGEQDKQIDSGRANYGEAVQTSSEAIPLPYAGPLLPGSQPVSTGYDVPMAPASQAAGVGPPAPHNTASQHSSLADFLGKQVTHVLTSGQSSSGPIQEARKEWLPTFLASGGLSKLVNFLKNLSRFHFTSDGEGSEPHQGTTKDRIAKRCLTEVMGTIKVLLMGLLCAQPSNQGLALDLVRKLSGCNVEEENQAISLSQKQKLIQGGSAEEKQAEKDQKRNKMKEEQENTQADMLPLTELLRTRPDLELQEALTVGLASFQGDLLRILAEFMSKKDTKVEDRSIISQGLSIWMSCVASDPALLNRLYEDFYRLQSLAVEQAVDSQRDPRLLFASTMVERGLVSGDFKVREAFASAIRFIVESVSSPSLSEPPLLFFLRLLMAKLDFVQHNANSRHAKLYFALLKELLPSYLDAQLGPLALQFKEFFDPAELLRDLIARLTTYQPTEKRSSFLEDCTLIGLIETIAILIEKRPNAATVQQLADLAKLILERCLFSLDFEPADFHITQDIQLEPIEREKINKCHAKESVQAAYSLLLTLCRAGRVPGLPLQILKEHWLRQVHVVDKPQKPGFAPLSDGRSWQGYCGIKNLGAVCYMNSMIQQFYHVPTLRYCLLAVDDGQLPDLTELDGKQIDDNVLHQLMRLFGFLQLSDRQYYNPAPFCYSFKAFDGQPTNVREQKDAQEFLNVGFDRLETLLKGTSQKYLLQNVFGGSTCSMMKCKSCGALRQNKEDFYNLSLEVKNQSSVYDGLKKFVSGEIISDYQCESCNQRVELEKKVAIDRLPNTLIIHLQRIIFDFDRLRNVKLNDRVEFPTVLNLKEFTTAEVLRKDKQATKLEKKRSESQKMDRARSASAGIGEDAKEDEEEAERLFNEEAPMIPPEGVMEDEDEPQFSEDEEDQAAQALDDADFEFKLVGVVCHMGSADAGHYLSYINTDRDRELGDNVASKSREEWLHPSSPKWLEFNDSTVQSFSISQLDQNCFGGHQNQNAYVLIYERRVKEKMKVVIPKEVVRAALACDGTATSSAFDTHLFGVFPHLKQQLLTQREEVLQYDKEQDEHYVQVDFAAARKFVPNAIYRDVHSDNLKFLSEKQVFSEAFYTCTQELIELSIDRGGAGGEIAHDRDRFELVFRLLDRVTFDLLVNSSANSSLKGMTDLLLVMLSKSDEAVEYLITHRVFAAKESLGKDEKNFFEMLATHVEKDARELASRALCFALNRLLQMGGESRLQLIDDTLTQVLDLMPNECTKHWQRLDTYLTFLYDLARSNVQLLHLLVRKKVVTRLMDLMGRYNPSSMLYVQANPPLESLVLTVSFIARSIPCLVDPADLYADEALDHETATLLVMAERGASQHHKPLEQSFALDKPTAEECQLLLPEDCLKSLFLHIKSFKLFYANASKHGYATEEYSKFVAHLCYRNREFSKKMAKHILKGTNKSNADELGPFLELMKQVLLVDDELANLRLEWIFGVADIVVKSSSYQMYNSQPKVGVANAEGIGAQVFRYFSPILKNASSLYSNKESALQALLSNRKSQSQAVLYSLKCILEAVLDDPKHRILNYLQTMDPPTYQYARYWDWIKPWVENEVATNTRNQHIPVYRAELELSINVLSLLESVERQEEGRPEGGPPASQRASGDLIQYPETDGGPKPFLIWELIGQDNVDHQDLQDGSLAVGLVRAQCSVSLSMPTGEGNFTLLDAYPSQSGYQGIQGGSNGMGRSNMKRVPPGDQSQRKYGRGTGGRRIAAAGTVQRPGRQQRSAGRGSRNKGQQKPVYQPKRLQQRQDNDADSEEESVDEEMASQVQDFTTGHDDQAAAKSVRFEEAREHDDGQGNNREPQSNPNEDIDLDIWDQSAAGGAQDLDMEADHHNEGAEQQIPDDYIPEHPTESQANEEMQDAGQQEPEDDLPAGDHGDQADPNEEDEAYAQQYQSSCLLTFKVQNSSHVSKTLELTVQPRINENGVPSVLNFRCPESPIVCEVYSTSSKNILHLTKLDPQIEEWGDFVWSFKTVEKAAAAINSWSNGANGNYGESMMGGDTGGAMGQNDNDPVAVGESDWNAGAGTTEKSCPACTFLNSAYNTHCEVCTSAL